MPPKLKNLPARFYTGILGIFAHIYRLAFKNFYKSLRQDTPFNIVLLVSRPMDVDLLLGLHEKARHRQDICIRFWLVDTCFKRNPEILEQLKAKKAIVGLVVSFFRMKKVLFELIRTHAFLSTVESSAAKHKLPYMITKLANAVGVSTYTLQHGLENIGLSYYDEIHGPDIKFAAKTIFTWGQVENLPHWVGNDTRAKSIAVGYPKKLDDCKNKSTLKIAERHIIGVFDNLHWHRYSEKYVSTFLSHLEEIAERRQEFHFVLKPHPQSIRNRNRELTARQQNMAHVDVTDWQEEKGASLTTSWLLSNALGLITTPSTIALDGALAKVPIAVSRYGLDLSYYSPLFLLDKLEDWQTFLDCLTDNCSISYLEKNGTQFINRVIVSGDPSTKILNLMTK